MKENFEVDLPLFTGKKIDNISVINFKENLPLHLINLNEKEQIFLDQECTLTVSIFYERNITGDSTSSRN